MQLAPGIHRIDSVRGANAYIVDTEEGLMLVDTGMPANAMKIADAIEDIGYELSEVRTIAITHADVDHLGSAARLKELTGARIAIHEADAPRMSGEARHRPPGGPLRWFFGLFSRLMPVPTAKPDVLLHDGDCVGGWQVVHVPGHTLGSIAFERDGVIFSGDALVSDEEHRVVPPQEPLSEDHRAAVASAEKIRAMGWRLLLPGHGDPVRMAS
jgi:hydroxyacylglutathione hydrolase